SDDDVEDEQNVGSYAEDEHPIRTFVDQLRPLLMIDKAHLKGQYKGTILLVVGMDGNNQIVPISYGICIGETGKCWSWWLSIFKECIDDNMKLVIISDRHPTIALAVHNQYLLAFHGIRCRHLMMNLSLKKKKTKGLYSAICKVYTRDEFASKMNTLNAIHPNAYNKLIETGVERWFRAHCPRARYNYCTSNSMESVNACIVTSRKLPVTLLTESFRKMVQNWYYERQKFSNMKYEITDKAADKVEKRKIKSVAWVVYGVNQTLYQVDDGQYTCQVNLANSLWECHKWQLFGIPCGYFIAVTSLDSGLMPLAGAIEDRVTMVTGMLEVFESELPKDLSTMLIPNDSSLEETFIDVISEDTKKGEEAVRYLTQM
ncbi:transposase, MuDR, MULE transposase domain protein, partial [Tanacetum coccineum]